MVPIATRIAGVIKLFSKEYFTRKTIPRKRTNPPIQAKSFTPKNASQSNGFAGGGGATGGGGGGGGGTSSRAAGTCGIGGGGGIGAPGGTTDLTNGAGAGTTGSAFFASVTGGAGAVATPRTSNCPTRWTRLRTADLSFRSWTKPII